MTHLVLLPRTDKMAAASWDLYENYYKPVVGYFFRQRLHFLLGCLRGRRYRHLLDVGYGCGVFLPALAGVCEKLSAVDIHDNHAIVAEALAGAGVSASVRQGNILSLPYPDAAFDALVCGSVLEHLKPSELAVAMNELDRVSAPDAVLSLGFPVKNAVTDLLFRFFGFKSDDIHPSDHRAIYAAIRDRFTVKEWITYPRFFPLNLSFYTVCRCVKKTPGEAAL